MEVLKGLEHLFYMKRLRELRLQTGEGESQGDLIHVHKCLQAPVKWHSSVGC